VVEGGSWFKVEEGCGVVEVELGGSFGVLDGCEGALSDDVVVLVEVGGTRVDDGNDGETGI
jgi:hypothetical protein